jgi:6-phosphogluconolactonase
MDRRVLENPSEVAAERIATVAAAGGHVALTGGSTPRQAYEQAASMEVDWSGCTFWFGDERCVPPDDERSNYGMAHAALLSRITDRPPVVRRMEGELGPHAGAEQYERTLRETFGDELPALDLVLLGLGQDAHCASLFPNHEALNESRRLATGVEQPGLAPFVSRITLTLPVLNAAREVVFLVTGADKAEAVQRAFGRAPDPSAPASLVAPAGNLVLLADAAAAKLLTAASRS